jgi:predicted AAA+ superfamily ATPase
MSLKFCDNLSKLLIYRNLLEDSIIVKLKTLAYDNCEERKAELTYELITQAEALGLEGNIVQSYVIHLIGRDQNIFSIQAEKTGGNIGNSLYKAAVSDIQLLRDFIRGINSLLNHELLADFTPTQPQANAVLTELKYVFLSEENPQTPEQIADQLLRQYVKYGYGALAEHPAFRWVTGQGLVGIPYFDRICLQDIIGYERQKHVLIANTAAFAAKRPANNVLLTGARGTGKSSLVKALANHYYDEGIRLVEVSKHDQKDLYRVLSVLRGYGKRFILFLDDLSFEENESDYKHLKSILEGGVEAKPENIVIYATSNRQHLIRETWNDRSSGNADDLHRFDTVHEKLSLADRFGITVTFTAPNQEEYFTIIEELARKHKLDLPHSHLRAEAVKWEMSHSGRSGRSAQQFITHLLGSTQSA